MEERIIKARLDAEAPGLAVPKVMKKEVYDAGVDARRIVERAEAEAAAILEGAQRRRSEVFDSAREEGYREGMAQWAEALRSIERASDVLHTRHEAEIVKLAVRVAGKIIGEELQTRPEAIAAIVREALRSVRQEGRLTVRVNPGETAPVERMLSRVELAAGSGRRIELVADPEIGPAGCVIQSEIGTVDARLETQLQRLEEILLRIAPKRS